MENDDVLRKPLVSLAAITVFTGVYTQSLKKMGATYLFGMFLICCIALPDWPFFNRPLSQWRTLNTLDAANHSQSRLKLYPVRLLILTAVYASAFYQWWNFVRA
ncbi:hypothetical protein ACS0TY_024721 [Phlomoides rotata]